MRKLQISILGWLATVLVAGAQITQPGWFHPTRSITPVSPGNSAQTLAAGEQGFSPLYSQNTPIAETITPDIQALADGLQDDPVKIFNYVHDHIRFVLYFGSKKGAELTYLEKSGNDFDQCALLVALLRAAGYSPSYQFGLMEMPLDAADGTHNDLRHWLHLTVVNTNWDNTLYYFSYLLGVRGYPTFINYGDDTIGLQRVWVTLTIGSTNYVLDPAFKVGERVTNQVNLASAMGFNSNALMTIVGTGATGTTNYIQHLNEANLRNTLAGYTTNLLNYFQSNCPNASVQQILGGWQIVPSTNTTLSRSLLFAQDTYTLPVETWTDEPTNLMSSLDITFARTNYQWWMPQLQGDRVTLLYTTNGSAQLWQDDTLLVTNQTTASDTNVILSANPPYGTWDFTSNVLVDSGYDDQISTNNYQRTNATYDILYAFEPDWGWLKKRQNQLDMYLQEGLPTTSRQVVSETLNIMGLNWLLQTADIDQIAAGQYGVLPENVHRLGRMAQEAGRGYYVDAYMEESGLFSSSGADTASFNNRFIAADVSSYLDSALESGIIEQLQNSNLVAASTVKMLQIANTNGQAVYLATSDNWNTIKNSLVNYDLNFLGNLVGEGYTLLLPQNGYNTVAGSGTWGGSGFVAHYQSNTVEDMYMLIGGGYNGGYASQPDTSPDSSYVDFSGDNQFFFFDDYSPFLFNFTAGDPVDVANGTFQVEHTDLSLGGPEPRGITLSRYYNGIRRYNNPAGMAGGWVNNYCVNAAAVAAPQAGLGNTTPAQMAPMLAAFGAEEGLYSTTPNPTNWMVTALIAKWGVDQLNKNGVSVNLGKDTVQFVKQPNGTFTPPANCTMTLIQTNGVYWLRKRHGNTFKFDSRGRLTNIVDQYSQPLTVSYLNSTSSLPQTVTDWKGRYLTFHYAGTPLRLTSVSDSAGRSVSYGYSTAYNPQGDLTSFTDAESKITAYTYDTNHEITATINALNQMVVSNVYDSQGHVAAQYTQGDPDKMWRIFWSDWQTVAQDPAGGQQTYFYDDQSRLIGFEDALNNLTHVSYDGQDHVVMTISPLDETNQYFYDGHNNLIEAIDPLGFTNQFVYDDQNNLIRSVDERGNPTTFGYNDEFSLTGQTNAVGDWVNYTYTTSGANAGTLASRADSGGTTYYGYDAYGQLNSIGYPGIGTNTFVNDSLGDVTNHTDPRGFTTTFQYNNRRELTNTIAPTNLVTSVAYDAADNVSSTTDARRNTTSKIWSATRKLLATVLPAMPQGTPVITNFYDNRDWLTKTLNPLQEPTLYTNDPAHRLISQTDPVLRTTAFSYNADGRKLATVNAAYETNSQTWSARGKLIALTDGAQHTSLRAYDGAGNQITLTNRRDKVWHFRFDAANRLTNTITPLGRHMSQTWNHQGLLSSSIDPSNRPTYFYYDAKGRMTNRTDDVGTILYGYDANDNRTSVAGNGLTNSWTYDAYNRVSTYKDAYGNLIQYRYDANGNLTNLVYPGNKNVYYAYDSNNHLTNVVDWAHRKTSMTYDLAGRLKTITRPNGTERVIDYDAAGQVTNILEQTGVGFPIALFRFDWNDVAEIQWEFAAPLPHTNAPPYRTMAYDDDNRLYSVDNLPVTVDSDGNLISGPLTNDNFFTYTFDARNRLLNVGGVTNVYDAMNNRIRQSYGTNSISYVVNPNAKLPQVLERIKNGVTTYYVYGAGLLYQVTETATSTNALYYHYDYRGSTIALTDDSGNVKDRFEYSLYATLTYRTGADDTPFLFNGRYGVMSDPNGLLYMRARYYSPFLCRFINPDPSGFSGGLNFYAYANGNPVSYLDASGLSAFATGDSPFSWTLGWNGTPTDLSNPFGFGFGAANGNSSSGWLNNLGLSYDLSPNITGWQSIAFSGGAGNNFAFPGGTGAGWSYDNTAAAIGTLGLSQSIIHYGSGVSTVSESGNIYLNFSSGFYGNQWVSAAKISDIAEGLAPPLAALNVGVDTVGWWNGDISTTKLTVNSGAIAVGLWGGGSGAVLSGEYFLIDTTYPGGWPTFLQNVARPASANFLNSEIMVPGIKPFHP